MTFPEKNKQLSKEYAEKTELWTKALDKHRGDPMHPDIIQSQQQAFEALDNLVRFLNLIKELKPDRNTQYPEK